MKYLSILLLLVSCSPQWVQDARMQKEFQRITEGREYSWRGSTLKTTLQPQLIIHIVSHSTLIINILKTINMNWISTKDRLPEEGKYVLARHNRGTWRDNTDQENVNCVVVKLVNGLSEKDRQLMKEGKLPSKKEGGTRYDGSWDNPIYSEIERFRIYKSEDEHENNLVPYNWQQFGPDSFFGQTITHWMPIEPLS